MGHTEPATLAIVAKAIRTLDSAAPLAEAVAVRDGHIDAVGDAAEIRARCGPRTRVVSLPGATVVPGLVDSHIHPFWLEQTLGADLTACASIAELRSAMRAEADRKPLGWVYGWGLRYEAFDEPVGSSAIAAAVRQRPALVTFVDQHTALATPASLAAAGLAGPADVPADTHVIAIDGALTGELRETAAIALVRAAAPPVSDGERHEAAVALQRDLNAVGLTGVHAMDGSPATLDLMRRLEDADDLSLRALIPFWQKPDMSWDERVEQAALGQEHGQRWRAGVAKLFVDGVIETGTGWLLDPDSAGDGRHSAWPDGRSYAEVANLFARAGFQCATHATGDAGVRCALDVYASLPPKEGVRHRIEHIETLDDGDLSRFAQRDVVASMQPLHMQWRSADGSDPWSSRLGPERAARAFRTRDLLSAGATVALGSDWPVASFDPRVGMAWARLRRRPGAPDAPVFEPAQRLTGNEALHGYTIAAAAVAGESRLAGRIAPGCRADLTAFADDPVDVPADELPDLPVVLTVVDGQVVFGEA